MHESSVIQHFTELGIEQGIERGIEQGIERGERKGILGSLLDVLESRFQTSEVHALKLHLRTSKKSSTSGSCCARQSKCRPLMNSSASWHQTGTESYHDRRFS